MDTHAVPIDPRYLKTPDGVVYGPVDPITLCAWAAEARITPVCEISRDGQSWRSAVEIPELRMQWEARLPDRSTIGPLNLFALWELIQDGSLPRGLPVSNRVTGQEVTLDEHLLPVALKESRETLGIMAAELARLLAEPSSELDTLRTRIVQAERDVAENLRLVGESQRLLVAREQQIKTLEAERTARTAEAQALKDELARTRADADSQRDAAVRAETAWRSEREALDRRCADAETQAGEGRAAAEAAESRATALATQLEAVRGAAAALKAEYEGRVAEARQAAADAASQAEAARAAMAAELAQAQTALAQASSDTEREAAARRQAENDVKSLRDRLTEQEGSLGALRRSAAETEAVLVRQREVHDERIAGLEARVAEAEGALAEREASQTARAKERETEQAETRQHETELMERAGRLERELEQTIRRLNEAKTELAAAKQALADERRRSGDLVKRTQAELKAAQRDLHALTMVRTAARQLRDEKHGNAPHSIDWLSAAPSVPPAGGVTAEPADAFAGLDLPRQVEVLHAELKASVQEKERLRQEMAQQRAEHEDQARRFHETERSLDAKLSRLQNEVESGATVLRQTMEELEKRESAWRQGRKKAEEREKELQERITAMEADVARAKDAPPVVVEGEWESPAKANGGASEVKEAPPTAGPSPVPGEDKTVLNSVEAQLRAELEKWHVRSRDKARKSGGARGWFRWKQS